MRRRWVPIIAVLMLIAAACSSSEPAETTTTAAAAAPTTVATTLATTTTQAPTTTQTPSTTTTTEAVEPAAGGDLGRSLVAPVATITVDGDPGDWALIPGLATTLEPIVSMADSVESLEATIRMAYDDENVYALFTIDDDYNFNADDLKFSAAIALLFPVDTGGPAMGADDEDGENSTGMVDIWHWEAECAPGVESGGVNPQGEGKDPGNDSLCNFDDEWATDAETREDDNGDGAENSLFGVWSHTNPVEDGSGVYYFEMSRPLQTGDAQDAQFTAGESTTLALAYWDVDWSDKGWTDDSHVQSANEGWINVDLVTATAEEVSMERSLDAPAAAITVDGDPGDWALIPGLATTLEPIVEMADSVENLDATIRMAYDDENVYALFTIDDDYNFNADDLKLSAAIALLFPVDTGGPAMGADDEDGENSTGMVDIWHWEAECAPGVPSGGGAGHPQGEGKDPGNDANCNFDDEWATDAETREDDNLEGAENSFYGVWSHTNPVEDGPGVYYFEMSRPLQTGDAGDVQFTIGESTTLALAYWDVDWSSKGWTDDGHVQSANQGWIVVNLN